MSNSQQMKLSSRITLGLSKEDKEALEKCYTSAGPYMERIVTLLSKDLEKSNKEGDDFSKFELPNWGLAQAHLSGQREALRSIINLLTIKSKVDHDL